MALADHLKKNKHLWPDKNLHGKLTRRGQRAHVMDDNKSGETVCLFGAGRQIYGQLILIWVSI